MSHRTSSKWRPLPVLAAVLPPLAAAPAWLAAQPAELPPPIEHGDIVIELETIATGLNYPNLLTPSSDGSGRLFVTNQRGRIDIIDNGMLLSEPLMDIEQRLVPQRPGFDERGLLGMAFHPGFSDPASPGHGKLYTYTSEPVGPPADFTVPKNTAFDHQSVIAEWQIDPANPNRVDLDSRREVMRIDQPQFNHNGGMITFRETDGYLYIALGDGGGARDRGDGHNDEIGNAQDLTNVLGSILRIDPLDPALTTGTIDMVSANQQYRVPYENPFVFQGDAVDEIWAYGLRNPWRFSFDSQTDMMLIADVGQRRIEEVNIGEAGGNFGWVLKEGTFMYDQDLDEVFDVPDPVPPELQGLIDPIAQYTNRSRDPEGTFTDGTAIIGGFIYRGSLVPELQGKYVFGDFTRVSPDPEGRLFYLDPMDESGLIQELIIGFGENERELGLYLLGFGLDDEGEIYVLGGLSRQPVPGEGFVLRIIPEPSSAALLLGMGAVLLRRGRRT